MDLFMAISQGVGASLATGLRSFVPPLLVCAMARGNLAVDFDGSDFEFLESVPFLAALLAATVVTVVADRGGGRRALEWPLLAVSIVLGALIFAGSLAEKDYAWAPGLAAGAACVVLAYMTAQAFLGGARARLSARGEQGSANFLDYFAAAAGVALAALAVLVPPISYVALAFCAWILIEHRRRGARKYEGLRILR
jgi:uncharacterized protein DUF4126